VCARVLTYFLRCWIDLCMQSTLDCYQTHGHTMPVSEYLTQHVHARMPDKQGRQLLPYNGPTPPEGVHNYHLALYSQRAELTDAKAPTSRSSAGPPARPPPPPPTLPGPFASLSLFLPASLSFPGMLPSIAPHPFTFPALPPLSL